MSDISKTTSSSGVVHREDAETRIGAILKGSASCWEEAVQQYIEKHPKKSITFINKDEGIRDCEVKVAAQDIIGRYKESSEISKVGRFAKQLSQYCEILDLFCEQQPYQVAVVWGFFRFLIKVTAHEEEVRELIAEGLDQALRYINLGNNTLKSLARGQYQTPSVSNVQSSVVRLFSHTVYFLQEAWEYIGRKKLARLKQAIFSSFKAEFKSKLEGLKQEALDIITAMQWTTYETIQASTSVLRLEIQNPEGHTARSDIEEIHSSLANNGRDIDKATPETCDWVQNDPTYQQWRAEPHGILWLLGEMGSGKSVLTKYLAKSSTESPNFAFFFSRMRCPGDSTPELFVGCLLMYMMQNQKPARNAFPLPRQLDRKWDLIHKLLGEYKEFDIFIDGLDECTFQHEQAFEDWMLQLETLQRSSGVRIIISSRPHRGILAHAQRGMQLVLGGDGSKRDAVTFTTKFIASNSSLSPFRESIMRTLSERPSYNILEIQMRLMAACRARTNTQALDCIQKLPSRLSEIYQEILDETESRIEKADYGIRREIFMLLFRQREPLTARHISAAYALKPMDKSLDSNDLLIDPANAILDICYPLVTIRDGYVSFTHVSIKEFLELHVRPSKIQEENLRLSNEESDKYFARKCLSVLLLEQYSSPRRIGMLLHRNLLQDVSRSSSPERFEDTDDFHQYAATNWVNHLTAIENPDHDILILANDFISTFSFVHWSEYVVKRDSDFAVPFRTRYRLMRWLSTLPDSSQDLVDTTKYFEGPYTTLSEHYGTEAKDRELQWLCLYRLARYFIQVDYKRAHRVLQQTVEGLTILLGPENPLTLLARTDYAKLLLGEGLMKEARDNFLEIWDIQREVSPDSVDAYTSLALAGLSSYYMTYFDISKQQQQQAYDGLAKRIGANHYDTLCSRLYLAYAKAGLGSDGLALDEFSEVYKARSEVHGRDDGLSIMSLAARGQSERILDRLESARDSIQQAWESRLRLWNLSHANVIDTAIHLLITYRDMGLQDEAQSIISRLNLDQIREQQYLRYCQITHIRGLLLYDEDEGDFGIGVLQNLLSDNKKRARGNNRWLMWVRLSLAQMMTEHDEGHEVLGLFEGIIRKKQPDTEDISHNGESPKLLELAMKVLSLVRKRMYSEAETCLRDENCEWVRESDLWIPVGGPAAETGLMRGPWIG